MRSTTLPKIQHSEDLLFPERRNNPSDIPRKVGVEIEFAGIDTRQAAEVISGIVGGEIQPESEHRAQVKASQIGDIRVELDLRYVHPDENGKLISSDKNREGLGVMLRPLVPQELVTKPIEIEQLATMDKIATALATAGAKGTEESLVYAFGLHLNPEIAAKDADYFISIMRAITLLEEQIEKYLEPDLTREVIGWAQPYTAGFQTIIMDPAYAPDLKTLISDYIRENKGRNHHLDMLPVFRHLENNHVTGLLGEKHPGSRPAFHFRLPDSRIGDENWSVKDNWNLWVTIENFADQITTEDLENWQQGHPV